MSSETARLVLNLRGKTLYGRLGARSVFHRVEISPSLLPELRAGRYTVTKPINDPLAGSIATVRPASLSTTSLSSKIAQRSTSISSKIDVKEISSVPGAFVLNTRTLSGRNQITVPNGFTLMKSLQEFDTIELSVL